MTWVALLAGATAAQAQTPALLGKGDVEAMLLGKTTHWSRTDGSARWTITVKEGWFWLTPSTSRSAIKARYTLDDAGKLCFQWIEANLKDDRVVYGKLGDKVMSFPPDDLSKPRSALERSE